MRIALILFCSLLACSCAGDKFQNKTPEKSISNEQRVLPPPIKIEPAKAPQKIKQKEPTQPAESYQDYTFTSIVLKEGIPFENIIPRSKEQVAIYKKKDFFIFYYLKDNKLVLKKNYSFQELDKIKSENKYPEKVLKDLGVI